VGSNLGPDIGYSGCVFRRVRKNYEKRLLASSCLSVRVDLPLDGFSLNLVFEDLSKIAQESQVFLNMTRITGTLHENRCTFLIISRSVRRRMRSISDKSCRGNRNIRLVVNNFFFSKILPVLR